MLIFSISKQQTTIQKNRKFKNSFNSSIYQMALLLSKNTTTFVSKALLYCVTQQGYLLDFCQKIGDFVPFVSKIKYFLS
jgi:hypothetical protein